MEIKYYYKSEVTTVKTNTEGCWWYTTLTL